MSVCSPAEQQHRLLRKNADGEPVCVNGHLARLFHKPVGRRRRSQCTECSRNRTRKRRGIINLPTTIASTCELCGKIPERTLSADHDHETGEFRGWLCDNCNRIVAIVENESDLLMKAIKYVG